jgi:glutathione S-transferase
MVLENCKLTYFGIAGRGEATRLALSIGKVQFNDDRVNFKNWAELKPTTPWGSLPMLSLSDGTVIAQQRTMLRLVGKETGLYPTDSIAAAKVDELMDASEDIGAVTMKAGVGLAKEEKEAARKAYCEEGGKTYEVLQMIDQKIGSNDVGPFAVGDSVTIADLCIYCNCNNLVSGLYDGVPANTLDAFENLTALRKAVRSHSSVVKWYEELDSSITTMPASYGVL